MSAPLKSWRRKRLPADPEGMNTDRALWAQQALLQFIKCTGTDWEDALADLLADLMHLCDRDRQLNFARDLARARNHYAEETFVFDRGAQ